MAKTLDIAQTRLHARDRYAQLRAIRRLMTQLADDLGDLAGNRDVEASERFAMETLCDRLVELERGEFAKAQERLLRLSYGED